MYMLKYNVLKSKQIILFIQTKIFDRILDCLNAKSIHIVDFLFFKRKNKLTKGGFFVFKMYFVGVLKFSVRYYFHNILSSM